MMASAASNATNLNIAVLLSSVRPKRMAERVGKYLKNTITTKGMTPILLDPLKNPFEVVQVPIHFMPKPDEAPNWLKDVHEQIKSADGFIVASSEYNSILPPALTNMMDYFPPTSFRHRPCAILTYSIGGFGGIRASMILRAFTTEFGLLNIPTSIAIPTVQNAISEDGNISDTELVKKISNQIDELKWYAIAIKNQKSVSAPPTLTS